MPILYGKSFWAPAPGRRQIVTDGKIRRLAGRWSLASAGAQQALGLLKLNLTIVASSVTEPGKGRIGEARVIHVLLVGSIVTLESGLISILHR